MHGLLWLFAGSPEKTLVRRKMWSPHRVVIARSGHRVRPVFRNGSLDWHEVLEQQCRNPERNRQIAELSFSLSARSRYVLILCKRVCQVDSIYETLVDLGANCDRYVGSSQDFRCECDVLVSSFSKSGVGFDFPKLDTLIIASDVDAFVAQYHGRIFRGRAKKGANTPLVVDILDNGPAALQRHSVNRAQVYRRAGGEISRVDSIDKVLGAVGLESWKNGKTQNPEEGKE
jgi:superfamily II DNA or RNA helicase